MAHALGSGVPAVGPPGPTDFDGELAQAHQDQPVGVLGLLEDGEGGEQAGQHRVAPARALERLADAPSQPRRHGHDPDRRLVPEQGPVGDEQGVEGVDHRGREREDSRPAAPQ